MKAKIFDCIDARRIYDCLLRTPHLLQLVTYLINDQRAHNMILFVIKSGKHAEACDLACMHYAKLRGAVPEGEKEEILRQFLAESLDKFDRTDQDFINRIIL